MKALKGSNQLEIIGKINYFLNGILICSYLNLGIVFRTRRAGYLYNPWDTCNDAGKINDNSSATHA